MEFGECLDNIRLRNAIKAYEKEEHKSAFQTFKSLASRDYSDSTDKSGIKIYELTEDDEKKSIALISMTSCYNKEKKLIQKEEIAFKISLELYSKKKYKEAFDIFFKLTSSTNDEIKFIVTCLKASYNISGYQKR
ncbi:24766_t:CDS:2 [Gigaspora margarita]|uniref:24766_t:CDS:1 n=1 Tax=Gigaspora margarita TaxID=4874 RepID=A0ABN7W7A5_GIGMA|nr:24766_t:CDS:2 [Gigaspora margarita]